MRRRWRRVDLRLVVLVAVAAAVALVLAVMSLRTPEPPVVDERSRPAEKVGPDRETPRATDRLAVIGDFWAAGPGLAPAAGASSVDRACGRSPRAFAHLVADDLGASLLDVSCAGAGPDEVGRGGSTDAGLVVPPQIEVLSDRLDVVLVSVGAEGDDLLDRTVETCQQVATADPGGAPCRRAFGDAGLEDVERDASATAQKIGVLLREITRRAPDARVLVVGYANAFPAGSACFDRSGVADGDVAYLREAMDLIVGATRSAAAAAGVEYLDPQRALTGLRCVLDDDETVVGLMDVDWDVYHDVFTAGASRYGVADLAALAADTHKFEARYLDGLVGPYPERRDLYRERSPINHTEGLSCPLILFQGLEDQIVPPKQAEMMFDAVRAKGLPTAYIPFEGEQHGFRRAENIKRALEAELYFYSKIFGFDLADPVEPVDIVNLPA